MKNFNLDKFIFQKTEKIAWLHNLIYGREIRRRIAKLEENLKKQRDIQGKAIDRKSVV